VKVDPSSGHVIQCIMEWESVESFGKAQGTPEGAEIFADIKNYTSGEPVAIVGAEIASG
jgi:hypothetical protein